MNYEQKLANIEAMQKSLDLLKADLGAPPPKQWEPSGRSFYVNGLGSICGYTTSHVKRIRVGTVYNTKKQAELASAEMRKHNRLLAYVAEFDVDDCGKVWEPTKTKWFVLHDGDCWRFDYHHAKVLSTLVYMSESCARNLASKLTSGEVIL